MICWDHFLLYSGGKSLMRWILYSYAVDSVKWHTFLKSNLAIWTKSSKNVHTLSAAFLRIYLKEVRDEGNYLYT